MSRKTKKISYANTVRRSTSLDIKEIPIKQWLKHHGLEDFHHTIFLKKHMMYTYPSNEEYAYEYTDILTNIETNVDLLFSFQDSFKFRDAISVPIGRKLYEMNMKGLITQAQVQDGAVEYKFFKAFNLLLSQKFEYKAMLSLFGIKPSKAIFNDIIETNLDFLDNATYKSKNIFKEMIIKKIKLFKFDDLLHCKFTTFRILLSISIEDIQKYILYTTNKLVNIKNGLKSSFTKSQFNRFIDNNESLKVFESCYNNYDLNYISKSLKEHLDAKKMLEMHRMDLFMYIFNPIELIDTKVCEKIYNTFFPDGDTIYIDSQFKQIKKIIPNIYITNEWTKKNKIRVFFIQGHGESGITSQYHLKPRVNFENVFKKINLAQRANYKKFYHNLPKYNAFKFNTISTQPVGRKSIFAIIILLTQILSSKHRKAFLLGLINSNTIEHLRILENIVHMYWVNFCIEGTYNSSELKLSEYLKKTKLKRSKNQRFDYFKKTDLTTNDIVNFVKYGYQYPPINTEFFLETNIVREGLIGVFELNEDTADDFIKLDTKIISKASKDNKLHLGLKLNEVYDFKGDIPETTDEILKYNRALKSKSSNMYTLEELMELIYLEGDIKSNEQVIIFDNSCRGLRRLGSTKKTQPNTINNLSHVTKLRAALLRATSMENSLEQTYKVGSQKKTVI